MPEATAADLLYRPATELARLVRDGEASARELVEASLARIEAVDDRVNAFVDVDADGALATADAIGPRDERPLAGVPVAIKTEVPTQGRLMTMGSDLFGDFRPTHDAFAVRRLRDAGAVIVGITSMPEMGIMPVTEPRRFGPTRNPWDLERTPGGSSGGSGAAVAAGMVPVAHGADGGGSLRIPAACNGLVGLKATRNRISRGPDVGEHWLSTQGGLSRTVADSALLLDVLGGYELGDANWAPAPEEPFAAAAAREPRPLRIGLTTFPPIDCPVDPTCADAVAEAGKLLEELGHHVEEVDPQWRIPAVGAMFVSAFGSGIALAVLYGGMVSGREPTAESVEPMTWAIYQHASELSAVAYLAEVAQLQGFARGLMGLWQDHDVLLTPSLAQRPVPIGEYDTGLGMEEWARTGEFTPYTAIANITGQPAISLPLFQGPDGLPTGVHLIGPPAGEALLLSLSAQIENARPWADRVAALD